MAVLTTIARRVVGLAKAGHATEKRVGWIENEMRNLRLAFEFLDRKIRDLSDQDNQNELPSNPTSGALKKKKTGDGGDGGGGAGGAMFLINDTNCIGGEGMYRDVLGLAGGDGIGLVVTPGAPVADPGGNEPPLEGFMQYDDDGEPITAQEQLDEFEDAGGDLGDWEPTFGGVDVEITHLAVDGASKIGGAPCAAICPPMTPELIVSAPTCSAINFAGGPLYVDCAGHVHEMYQHTLEFASSASYTTVSCEHSNELPFVKDVNFDCEAAGGSEQTFTIRLSIDRYNVSVYTGKVKVVKSVTAGSGGSLNVQYCCMEFFCGLLASVDCPSDCSVSSGGGY